MDYFLNIVEGANETHDTLIIAFIWVSLVMYFIVIRGSFGHYFCIQLNKKQRDSLFDAIFAGVNKNNIKRFVNWLLCRCYTDKQKTRLYPILLVVNYFYLFSTTVCVFVWMLSLIVGSLQWWSSLLICCRILFFDGPAFFGIIIGGSIKTWKK